MQPLCPPGRRMVMKAGAKDPRNMLRNVRGYNPLYQADQIQQALARRALQREFIPFIEAVERANRNQNPATLRKVTYVPYYFSGELGIGTASFLLIRANPNRINFYVSNIDSNAAATIYLSFGTPPNGLVQAPNAIPIQPGLTFSEINNTVSTDDIWISANDFPLVDIAVMGYEGVPDITSGFSQLPPRRGPIR